MIDDSNSDGYQRARSIGDDTSTVLQWVLTSPFDERRGNERTLPLVKDVGDNALFLKTLDETIDTDGDGVGDNSDAFILTML